MKIFQDKVAVITGGASGIGREVGIALAKHGAKVVLSDIDEPRLNEVASEIGASARVCDVRDPAAVQALVDGAVSAHGQIDYMFNNAGIAIISEVIDMELEDWYRIFDINLRGVVHGIHAAYPIMCTQGFGHIVNTASVAGLAPTPCFAAYGATKHAVVGLSRSLRAEAKTYGVKVSVACPGFIDTRIGDNALYHNFEHDLMDANLPFKMMAADKCAQHILKGVRRNKDTIVVTGHGKMIYRMQRWFPGIVERMSVGHAEKARRVGRQQVAKQD